MARAPHKYDLTSVNALAEFDRMQWTYEPTGEDEVRVICPAHSDDNPSASFNVKVNRWNCKACGAKGDIVTFMAYALKVDRKTILADLSKRYQISSYVSIDPSIVESYHDEIWASGPLLKKLRDRGITDDMIREARLGFDNGRITIPVYDKQGRIVNVRRYLPGAPSAEKMKNTVGYNRPAIYRVKDVQFDTVWICAGEMKALVVGGLLNSHKVGAISSSAGENVWQPEWSQELAGKLVYICMDIDNTGRTMSRKIARQVSRFASKVKIITLPLNPGVYPKGDVNDYVGQEKAGDQDLIKLMNDSVEFVLTEIAAQEEEEKDVDVRDVTDAENVGHRVRFNGMFSAMDVTPYYVPHEVLVGCDKEQPNCAVCPIRPMDQNVDTGRCETVIDPTSRYVLEIAGSASSKQADAIRLALGIPPCKSVSFAVRTYNAFTDVRITSQIEISDHRAGTINVPALIRVDSPELNSPYQISGRVFPHPKNQQAIVLSDNCKEGVDSLTSFAPSEDEMRSLEVFNPEEWTEESLDKKLTEINDDMSANVTRIFERRDMHVALDLAWHSPLRIPFDGASINGWLNVLVIGDSSQGKSETVIRLRDHYGLGERVDCKNATVAGLLGGLQQLGNRWFVTWGVIPTHDRRLVVLEEVKGASVEVIGKLTDMRSSGVAEIPKIERRRTCARTRLVFISNPRGNRRMASFNFGVEAIHDLIGSMEDVRRFDLGVVVSNEQIDVDRINVLSRERPAIPHRFQSNLSRRLILWAWTLPEDRIAFDDGVEAATIACATDMCKRYDESFPLVDRGTMRFKFARLAASLAARTFSNVNGHLLIRRCHVDWVRNYVDRMYSDSSFGYADFSRAMRLTNEVIDPKEVMQELADTKHPLDLIRQLLHRDSITVLDITDWSEMDFDDARSLMSLLVRKHCLVREKREYVKTPGFIDLLKTLQYDYTKYRDKEF